MSGLPLLSARRSLPSLCSIVDECSVESQTQSTPRIYLLFFFSNIFFLLRVAACFSLANLKETQPFLDFSGSGCQ